MLEPLSRPEFDFTQLERFMAETDAAAAHSRAFIDDLAKASRAK
jgi:hypothetical protein